MNCDKHPTYVGKSMPRGSCGVCWHIYVTRNETPERYRIPGDALELMKYRLEECRKECEGLREQGALHLEHLEAAEARVKELEKAVERNYSLKNLRIKELEQEVDAFHKAWRMCQAGWDNCQASRQELEQDRDSWRAKAGG